MTVIWFFIALLLIRMPIEAARLRSGVRGTTLTTTANWGLLVAIAWVAAAIVTVIWPGRAEVRDQFWYWTAVVSVVPPMAVLGAKRPGSEAWNFFVLVPLIFVLGWPALTVWTGRGPEALRVEAPVLIGFVLVLVMGCGNYVASRLAFPALLYALGVVFVLAPCSTAAAAVGISGESFRLLGALAMWSSTTLGGWMLSRPSTVARGPDRVWNDFRELFGIVWMKRAMDRINEEFADREQWPARLGTEGLEWLTPPTAEQRQQVEARWTYALHWLLRRFVDEDWIKERSVER